MKRVLLVVLVLIGSSEMGPTVVPSAAPGLLAQQAPTLRVYLARHGQTDGNANGIAQGWTDTPLNETGRRHAVTLAERLRGIHLDAIYSSTLMRSRETADTVAAGRGVKVANLPGLREMASGNGRTSRSRIPFGRRGRRRTSADPTTARRQPKWRSASVTL